MPKKLPDLSSPEVDQAYCWSMETFRPRSGGGDRAARGTGRHGEETELALSKHRGWARRHSQGPQHNSHGSSGGGGFNTASQGEYERWRKMSTGEDTAISDRTISVGDDDDSAGDDGQWAFRTFSTDDHHRQTTFGDSGEDRLWRFDTDSSKPASSSVDDPVRNWRVSFDGGEPLTNIDDLLEDEETDARWKFAFSPGQYQQGSADSGLDAWASVAHDENTTPHHEWTPFTHESATTSATLTSHEGGLTTAPGLDTTTSGARDDSWTLEDRIAGNGAEDGDDAHSVDTISTDTDSVFRRDEEVVIYLFGC